MEPQQVLPFWIKVDLRVMVIKSYSIFPKLQDCQITRKILF